MTARPVLVTFAIGFLCGALLTASIVRAAEAPRPALPAIPAGVMHTSADTEGLPSGNLGARTPAPQRHDGRHASNGGASAIRGRASWYAAAGAVAAAGPALRRRLGRHWRGTWVRVSAGGRSVVVQLVDWCECYRGTKGERLIDLSDDDFAVLAPLAAGVVRVEITPILPPATDTR